jgi:histidinol-phosphate aminotransferase
MGAPRERDAIAGLVPYEPGRPAADVRRELGNRPVVKLASNEGQLGPFPAALEAIAAHAAGLNRYPELGYELREAVAARHGVPADRVALGNGADALVGYLSTAFLDAGDEVALCWPSFVSYRVAAGKMDASVAAAPLRGSSYDLDALLGVIGPRTRIAYVCNPNNPTGGIVGREQLAAFVAAVPERVLVVVDEAYHEYVEDPSYPDAVAEHGGRENVCVLRTFSKMYGLAGLRVGYAIAAPSVTTAIAKVRPAFDVNELAQIAALASMGDTAEIERRRRANTEGREQLACDLRALGLEPLVSHGNFLTVEVGDAPAVAGQLEAEGVIVRPLGGFGDPRSIRITVGTPEQNAMCVAALGRVLQAVG